jgi:hypothetical protein
MADLNESQAEKPKLDPNDPLDRIAMEAMGEEKAREQADADFIDPPPPPGIDPAQTWGQIPFMFGKVLSMAMPELAGVYTEEKCYQWGVGMAAVSEKYGWDAGEVIGRFGPEIALAVASVPLVVPTYQAIKARREEKEREKAPPRQEKDITPAADHPMGQAPGGFVDPA